MAWIVYVIEKTGRYYTGITTDLQNRLRQHRVSAVRYTEYIADKYAAARREREIKKVVPAQETSALAAMNG